CPTTATASRWTRSTGRGSRARTRSCWSATARGRRPSGRPRSPRVAGARTGPGTAS
ncbi:MAG: hypothetical protein AVDCRST_MAG16-562, partial [uncultured Frankineae bacterium]